MQQEFRWFVVMIYVVCSGAMAAEPDPYLFDVVKKPAYAQTLKSLLDKAGKLPNWTREVRKTKGNYVASTATHVAVNGTAYDVFHACEPHECPENQLAIMFAPNGSQAWGVLFEEGILSYLGAPSDAQQAVLKKALVGYQF
jgi:hypothetical protein